MSDSILVQRPENHPGLQIIRFNRPEKKNAITAAMYRKMADALHAADEDADIRVTVFLGTEGCFSAGNDIGDFLLAAAGGQLGAEILDFLHALAGSKRPLVAGVDGLAIGVGMTLNLHCDLTFASTRTRFQTPFVDLGLVPEAASSLLGPRVMGHQRAFALLALGEAFSAAQALEAGLVWKVVDPADLERETLQAAERLAAKPPQALALARQLLRGDAAALHQRIDEEAKHFSERLKSTEARAAFEAFMRRQR